MSRSRKKTSSRRRMPRADWVYRSREVNEDDGSYLLDHESYGPSTFTVTAGVGGQVGAVLLDSSNYLHENTGISRRMPRASVPDRPRRPMTHLVSGTIDIQPTVWSLGQVMELGVRIGVWQQDAVSGDLITPSANYSMYAVTNYAQQPAIWANDRRNNLWERRFHWAFSTSNDMAVRLLPLVARARARLSEDECLGIYLEVPAGAVNLRGQFWLRTLVSGATT